jgi:hypothetical protein
MNIAGVVFGSCFQLIEAVARSAQFQPNHDDVHIIQAPHRRRNYQI